MTAPQQEIDQSPQGLTTIASVSPIPSAPRAGDDEVLALRQRVAQLEAELAAMRSAQAAQSPPPRPALGVTVTPPCRPSEHQAPVPAGPEGQHRHEPVAPTGEFDEPQAPAVQPVPNPGFAQAWDAETKASEEVSFEELFADRAFFDATSIDERSRNWLLNKRKS